jgi:DNA-directed RNA polymerase subunit RPC12/RpoP
MNWTDNKKQNKMDNNQKLNITIDKTIEVVCEECGSNVFSEVIMLRKASKFLTGTAQDALIPIPVFACAKCKHINSDMLSPDLKKETE